MPDPIENGALRAAIGLIAVGLLVLVVLIVTAVVIIFL